MNIAKRKNLMNSYYTSQFNSFPLIWMSHSRTITKFKFNFVSEDPILKILQNINENKAAGLDNLSGKFLKDGETVFCFS